MGIRVSSDHPWQRTKRIKGNQGYYNGKGRYDDDDQHSFDNRLNKSEHYIRDKENSRLRVNETFVRGSREGRLNSQNNSFMVIEPPSAILPGHTKHGAQRKGKVSVLSKEERALWASDINGTLMGFAELQMSHGPNVSQHFSIHSS